MSPDELNAAASIFSSLVITLTALAAFRQIRHMRSANEIQAFSAIVERWSAPETVASREFIHGADGLLRDPAFVAELRQQPLPERPRKMLAILTLLEEIGTLVHLSIVSERAIMTNYASSILHIWRMTEPAIRVLRESQSRASYRMFEDLASRAERWISRDEPRMLRKLGRMPDTVKPLAPGASVGDEADQFAEPGE
jgi:hypothetical protein